MRGIFFGVCVCGVRSSVAELMPTLKLQSPNSMMEEIKILFYFPFFDWIIPWFPLGLWRFSQNTQSIDRNSEVVLSGITVWTWICSGRTPCSTAWDSILSGWWHRWSWSRWGDVNCLRMWWASTVPRFCEIDIYIALGRNLLISIFQWFQCNTLNIWWLLWVSHLGLVCYIWGMCPGL